MSDKVKVSFWTPKALNESLKKEAEELGISKTALMNLKLKRKLKP